MMKRGMAALALLASVMGPKAAVAASTCTIAKMAAFPVTMHRTSPWTTVGINGAKVEMILDSGAAFSSLKPSTAQELNLRLEPTPYYLRVGGVGGEVRDPHYTVADMTVAGVTLPKREFLVIGQSGSGAEAGLLGQNILHAADVDYDLANGSVWLIRPHDCGNKPLVYWTETKPYSAIRLLKGEGNDLHTYADVYLNGVRLRAILDTGAGASVISRTAAARAGVTPDMPGAVRAGYSSGIGEKVNHNWIVPVSSFKIGDEEIKATRMRIADMRLGQADMLLGADFFLSHRVYVSNQQGMIYFTYNGGPVFNLDAPFQVADRPGDASGAPDAASATPAGAAADTAEPTTAEDFLRRSAAALARRDYDSALKAIDRAVALSPNEARYYAQRAEIRLANRQPLLAKADLDEALKRDPDNASALVTRAQLRMGTDRTGALEDLDRASSALPGPADQRFAMAAAYWKLDRLDKAVSELDRWIPAHPEQAETIVAYTDRCMARVLMNQDLDRAMGDCNRALDQRHTAANLTARGLLYLRRGDYARAISDFDGALSFNRTQAWALYGRALAERAKGDGAAAQIDFAAARAANARIGEQAVKRGFESEVVARP